MEPNQETTIAPATTTTAPAPKAKRVRKVAATVNPPAQVDTKPREALLAKVKTAIESAKGKTSDAALVVLREALAKVHATAPDVELSSNKEQRIAQLKQLREARANLGWQSAARMIGDCIANLEGVEQVRRFGARQLVNGSLVATENIRSTLKSSKQHRGISIR